MIEKVLSVIGATETYSDSVARNALTVFANMAQCKEAQKHLLKEDIIAKVLDSTSQRNPIEHHEEIEGKLLM